MIKMIGAIVIIAVLNIPAIVFGEELGIVVDKTVINFDSAAGEVQSFEIRVKNLSKRDEIIFVSSEDYILEDNNEIKFIEGDSVVGVKDWIIVENETLFFRPGESKKIKFTVNIPDAARVGSHYGAVIFNVKSDIVNNIKIAGQVGVHLLINVKGDTVARGKLNYFNVPFLTTGDVVYSSKFKNIGNVHYKLDGKIIIRNVITNFEDKYDYDRHFIFPGKEIDFTLKKKIPSIFGLYKVEIIFIDGDGVIYQRSKFIMGYLFPLACLGVVIIGWNIFKKIYVKN